MSLVASPPPAGPLAPEPRPGGGPVDGGGLFGSLHPAERQLAARLDALARTPPSRGLDPWLGVLERLGHPQRRLPPVIHVAGTNGKGSTVAVMAAILAAAGVPAHVTTSPHLWSVTERVVLAGRAADPALLLAALDQVEAAAGDTPMHWFQWITAMALVLFAATPAAVALIETGVGGRLDATNAIPDKAATAITAIGHDHQWVLGDTVAEITAEKAGILRAGTPAVLAPQQWPEAAAVLQRHARALGAPIVRPAPQVLADLRWRLAEVPGVDADRLWPAPALAGRHQYDNAGVAIAALAAVPGLLPEGAAGAEAIAHGLQRVTWPGRLQRLPALEGGPVPEVWFDVAHNPEGAQALAAALVALRPARPTVAIVARRSLRDHRPYLAALAPALAGAVTLTLPDDPDSIPAEILADDARAAGVSAQPARTLAAALEQATAMGDGQSRVVVTGTAYLAPLLIGHAAGR